MVNLFHIAGHYNIVLLKTCFPSASMHAWVHNSPLPITVLILRLSVITDYSISHIQYKSTKNHVYIHI